MLSTQLSPEQKFPEVTGTKRGTVLRRHWAVTHPMPVLLWLEMCSRQVRTCTWQETWRWYWRSNAVYAEIISQTRTQVLQKNISGHDNHNNNDTTITVIPATSHGWSLFQRCWLIQIQILQMVTDQFSRNDWMLSEKNQQWIELKASQPFSQTTMEHSMPSCMELRSILPVPWKDTEITYVTGWLTRVLHSSCKIWYASCEIKILKLRPQIDHQWPGQNHYSPA